MSNLLIFTAVSQAVRRPTRLLGVESPVYVGKLDSFSLALGMPEGQIRDHFREAARSLGRTAEFTSAGWIRISI
jgi:hypothetical protein